MTDRPIIFSGPMVRALLDGRKTQTRRVLKPPYGTLEFLPDRTWRPICTKWFQGDRLYVREAWRCSKDYDAYAPSEIGAWPVHYEADGPPDPRDELGMNGRYRHARFMPRWASRLTLTVTDVRAQRLQEISEADVYAEGAMTRPSGPRLGSDVSAQDNARNVFADLWNSLHGPDAWKANPWVIALTFNVHRGNIDKMEDKAND